MGRNRVTPNRGRLTERLRKIDPREIDRPHGRYIIDFFDDLTGRRVHREVVDNYISPLWEKHVLGYQYNNPWLNGAVAHNSTVYTRAPERSTYSDLMTGRFQDRLWNPLGVASLPMQSIIVTNDDTAEDTGDTWLRGLVTAYATRWKATVDAAGPRGLINESECAFSNNDNTHKTVWDWTTQQGNGTFQCLGIGAVITGRNPQVSSAGAGLPGSSIWTALGPSAVVLDDSIPERFGNLGTSWWSAMTSNPVFDGTNMFFLTPGSNSGADNYDLVALDEDDVMGASVIPNDEFVRDARGLTPTIVCDTGITHASNTSSTQPDRFQRVGLAKVGTEFVIAYQDDSHLKLRRITAAGGLVWEQTTLVAVTGSGDACSVVYDGSTHLYVTCAADGANQHVYRCNPATGAITATIPIPEELLGPEEMIMPAAPTWGNSTYPQYPIGMCRHTDGDLLIMTSLGIIKMTVEGEAASPFYYGLPGVYNAVNEAGVSPWLTTAYQSATYENHSCFGLAGAAAGIARRAAWLGLSANDDDGHGPRAYGVLGSVTAMQGVSSNPINNAGSGTFGHIFMYDGKLWAVMSRMIGNGWMTRLDGVTFIGITGQNFFSKVTLESPRTKTSSQNMKISYELTWPSGNVIERAFHPNLV